MKKITLFLFLTIISFVSMAQGIISDRPSLTESAVTIPRNAFQVESGIIIQFTETDYTTIREIAAPTTLFRYGLFRGFELRFLSEYQITNINDENISGMLDFEVGFKLNLLSRESTSIAFLAHMITPTGTIEKTDNQYTFINKLAFDKRLNSNSNISINLGYDYYIEDEQSNLSYALVYVRTINQKVSVFIESYGQYIDFKESEWNFDGGFTYLIRDHFQLDASFGFGVNYRMNFISAGLSWLITP